MATNGWKSGAYIIKGAILYPRGKSECALSCVCLFATPWTIAHQAPLSMEVFRQEYWSGLPFPLQEDLSNPGIQLESPALIGRFITTEPHGKPRDWLLFLCNYIIPSLIAVSSFIIAT